ncbi:MAG: methyltransferase domain-containing protein [Proteobacteria bacterium]|nr:methyltransferase domain-containing protein [Pseudomonadota bacterium]
MFKFLNGWIKCFSDSARCAEWLAAGNKYYVAGDYVRANKYYCKILRRRPHDFSALCNHAAASLFLKDYDAAKTGANTLIKNFPQQACGWSLRGRALLEEGGCAAAVDDLQQAVRLDAADCWNYNYLAQALQKCGRRNDAAEAALRAVEISGGEDSQQLNLAYTLYENSLEDGAASVHGILQKWHEKYPQNPIAEQSWKSFFYDENYTKPDARYVEKVFDSFAASFDETLLNLEYDSPRKIAEILFRNFKPDSAVRYQILDLGCGTGLCGRALDSLFKKRFLTGIDLSAPMLEKARAKRCYDRLLKAEIEQYLSQADERFDVVVSADVLTYFGALDKLFSRVHSVLNDGGCFAFSATRNGVNEKDYFLHPSGRFIHAEKYLENRLQKNGFRIVEKVDSVLRKEGENDVCGWIFLATKNI